MANTYRIGMALAALAIAMSSSLPRAQTALRTKILVLDTAGGYRNDFAIKALDSTLAANAAAWNLDITVSHSADNFTLPYLSGFNVVVLNNNTSLGMVIRGPAQTAFARWMEGGGGVLGVHHVMDHADTWKWFADTVALGKFSMWVHSCPNAHSLTQIQVDTTRINGDVPARKQEYAPLLSLFPDSGWQWCDRWMSFASLPWDQVDVLMTVNGKSLSYPMPGDIPVAWTRKLPPSAPGARPGRFFYTGRGFYASAYADPGTLDLLHFGICWAAARGFSSASCLEAAAGAGPGPAVPAGPPFAVHVIGNRLIVEVGGPENHALTVSTLSGRTLARRSFRGAGRTEFPGMPRAQVCVVRVRTGSRILSRLIAF